MNGTIELSDLSLFLAVAQRLSFSAAARRMGVPPSTLSRRVAAFEEAVGARLLHRTSRRVALTQEGARLLREAAPLLERLAEVVESGPRSGEVRGKLRVTAPVMTGTELIGPLLFEFAARHPGLNLELLLTNAVVSVIEDGFDLAFRAGPVRDAGLVARKVWSAPYVLAASREFVRTVLGGSSRVSVERLREVPGIVAQSGAGFRLRRKNGAVEVVKPLQRVVVNDPRVALDAAARGLGIVATPRRLAARMGLTELTVPARSVDFRELFAVFPSRRLMPPRVRLALDWIVERAPAFELGGPPLT